MAILSPTTHTLVFLRIMSLLNRLFAALLLVIMTTFSAYAKPMDYYLPEGGTYAENITTPEQFIGYQVGEFHVRHDQLVNYMRHLAQSSDRTHLIEMGTSWEKRPQVLLVISAPENIATLKGLLAEGKEFRESQQDKLAVWMGYSIHGNEPSGTNASLLSSYHFTALQGAEHEAVLQDTYIILEPSLNPDGYGRFSTWANNNRSLNLVADPMDREHLEDWPGGRTNHYRFDLNRDWLLATQNESKNRLKWFQYFHANVFGDFHEMGTNATYFFQPGVPSRNNPLTPEENFAITADIATYHAKALDDIGSLYYNKQSFDDFYYGKGSTYPDVQGSIGILFEQASARGHLQNSVNGPLHFPFAVRNQFVTSLSTLAGAYANKDRLIDYRKQFFSDAQEEAKSDRNRGLVISANGDKGRLMALVDTLLRHRIEVFELVGSAKIAGKTVTDGVVIPYQQRQYRLIKAMFETRTKFRDNTFYDVSTWNFGHAYNLPYEAVERRRWKGLAGAEITSADLPAGSVSGQSSVGYVLDWSQLQTPAAAQDLMQSGMKLRLARKSFELPTDNGTTRFPAGSVVLPVGIQGMSAEDVYTQLSAMASAHNIQVTAVTSGLANSGIDLGSPDMVPLKAAKAVMLIGSGISSYDSGHLWYFADNHLQMELSQVDKRFFSRLNLDNYTHLILVSGNYSSLSEKDVEKLRRWINGGGVVIGIKSANDWLAKQKLLTTEVSRTSSELNDSEKRAYSDMAEDNAQRHIGGSIFSVDVDTSHPLAFGLNSETLSAFKNHRHIIEISEKPYHNVMTYGAKPLVSGYISEGNLANIANSAYLSAERMGRGSVIAIADNPVFRGYWLGTSRVLSNSLFFGTAFSRPNQ